MRRPAFCLAVFFMAGIYVIYLLRSDWISYIAFISCLATFVFLILREKSVGAVLLCCFILGGLWFYAAEQKSEKHGDYAGSVVEIQGEVLAVNQMVDHAALTVETEKYGRIIVSVYKKKPDYASKVGNWIWVSGELALPLTAGNPGGFDYRLYLRSIGVDLIMQVRPEQLEFSQQAVNAFTHRIAVFRQFFEYNLAKQIGEEQTGLAIAMLFGDKSGLDDEMYESFQRNGTAHILSVSGLHVGFLYGILAFLLGGKRKPIPNIIILLVLGFYGVLSGFCPSVTRALLMIGLHMLSKVLCRPYDLLSSAGIAAFLILLQNPYSLFHVGFQLSFFAVVLMGWIFPPIHRWLPKGHILAVILPMPALQAVMAPYTAYLFNYFSFGAFVANFGVVFFSGLLIPSGLLAMISVRLPGPFFELTAIFMDVCNRCVVFCNNLTYAGGKTCIDVISPSIFCLVTAYGLFFFVFSETGRILWVRKKNNIIAVSLILIVAASGFIDWKTEDGFDRADAVFVDVGQGDCLHIKTPTGKNVLIDGGGKDSFDVGKRVLKPYLLKNGVRKADLAIITHLDVDHYDGIRSLANEGMVEKLGLYEGNRLLEKKITKDTGLSKEQLIYLHQEDKIIVDSFVWLEFLYPMEKSSQEYQSEIEGKEENPRSLVVRVHLGDYRILMTGDIDVKTEEEVLSLQSDGKASSDILKVSHHGSKYSTSDQFLDSVNPSLAVFQTGKNNYGHPAGSILEKCREKGIMIYRTDKNGAVGIFGLYTKQTPYLCTIRKGT